MGDIFIIISFLPLTKGEIKGGVADNNPSANLPLAPSLDKLGTGSWKGGDKKIRNVSLFYLWRCLHTYRNKEIEKLEIKKLK